MCGAVGGAGAPPWIGVAGGARPGRGDPRRGALLLGLVGRDHGGGARQSRPGCRCRDGLGADCRRAVDRDGGMVEGGACGAAAGRGAGRGARRRLARNTGWGRACLLRSSGAHGGGGRSALRPGGGGALFRASRFACGAPGAAGAAAGRDPGGDRAWPAGFPGQPSDGLRPLPFPPGGCASGDRPVGGEGRLRHEDGAPARRKSPWSHAPRGFSRRGTRGRASRRARS